MKSARVILLSLTMTALVLAGLVLGFGLASSGPEASAGGSGSPAFHLGIDTDGDASDECDTVGGSTSCVADVGTVLHARVYLDDLGSLSAYAGMNIRVGYSGVTQIANGQSVWTGCATYWHTVPGVQPTEAGCNVADALVSYTGLVVVHTFRCDPAGSGSISLLHGPTGGYYGNTHLIDDLQQPTAYFEGNGTSESVSITCGTSLPTPTPCPTPDCGSDFYIGIDSDGGADDCDTNGGPTTCQLPSGAQFTVKAHLESLGSIAAFDGLQTQLSFTGLTFQTADSVWPGCFKEGYEQGANWVSATCAVAATAPPVSFTGRVTTTTFTCSADSSIALVHGADATVLFDSSGQAVYEEGSPEVLSIDCVSPGAYPADSDGDGCPDMNEALPNPQAGGQRNFLNSYDYFNPSHDHQNRIDDVLLVVDQYFIDQGDNSYLADTDRTLLGPSAWNLGPPNGLQRVDDILNQVKQYFHDCS